MSAIHRLALISAAHNHVAIEGTEQSSLALFFALKAQSDADASLRVDQFDSSEIPSQYDLLTVLELVELIEHEAALLVSFSERIMQAAHQGLMEAAEEPGFEMDASRWDFKMFAEGQLATEQHAGELAI